MRVLVACEFSGTVRNAFRSQGHDAVSCDLLPAEDGGPHLLADALGVLADGWDLMVGHPPCTYLAVCGARWWKGHEREQAEAFEFFMALWRAPIPRVALEQPISRVSTLFRKPDQIIHPWQYGHGESKPTSLWLRGLPPLVPTDVVAGREKRKAWATGWGQAGADRWRYRSRTYPGFADAMAKQWGAAP